MAVAIVVAVLGSLANAVPARADTTFDGKMLELINQQRAIAGVAPLQWSSSLGATAEDAPITTSCGFTVQGRSKDMGVRNYFSHSILDCPLQSVFNLLGTVGIQSSASGENIAWMSGTTDPLVAAQNLTNSFMNSAGHRANILNPNYTHVGIGSWTTAAGQTWSGGGTALSKVWIATQVFAQMTVTTAPVAGVSPSSLGFGDRAVGTASTVQTATVNNTGNAPLTVSGTSLTGVNAGDFSIASNTCSTVPAGSSCSLGVVFKPGAAGSRSATLSVTDNASSSPQGIALTGTGSVATVPGAPTSVQAMGRDSALTVSWTPPANPGSAVDGYGIWVYHTSGYSGQSLWVCATCTSGTVPGLINGQSYYAVVYSHNALGWGGNGSSPTVVVGTPGAPTNVVVTKGNGQVLVSWTPPSGGPTIDYYALLAFDSTGYANLVTYPCGTCTTGGVAGLTNGRTYTIKVYAHNSYGWGAPTTSSQFVPGP